MSIAATIPKYLEIKQLPFSLSVHGLAIAYKNNDVIAIVLSDNLREVFTKLEISDFDNIKYYISANLRDLHKNYKFYKYFCNKYPSAIQFSKLEEILISGDFSISDAWLSKDSLTLNLVVLFRGQEVKYIIDSDILFNNHPLVLLNEENAVTANIEGSEYEYSHHRFFKTHVSWEDIKEVLFKDHIDFII